MRCSKAGLLGLVWVVWMTELGTLVESLGYLLLLKQTFMYRDSHAEYMWRERGTSTADGRSTWAASFKQRVTFRFRPAPACSLSVLWSPIQLYSGFLKSWMLCTLRRPPEVPWQACQRFFPWVGLQDCCAPGISHLREAPFADRFVSAE